MRMYNGRIPPLKYMVITITMVKNFRPFSSGRVRG